MDKAATYRKLIEKTLNEYDRLAANPPEPDVESLLAFDETRDQYLWFQVGWEGKRRIRGITVHVRIHHDKIWIEEDWTEDGIAVDLLRAGVPKSDIVLGFHHPEKRALAGLELG